MHETGKCPIAEAMNILSRKWAIILLYHLLSGPKRFGQLEAEAAISGRLLSERLKELEAAGMVTRTLYPEVPPRVEYALTEMGREVEPIITAIMTWSQKWLA